MATNSSALKLSGGYVRIPDNSNLRFTGSATMMCWVKLDTNTQEQYLMTKGCDLSSSGGWGMYMGISSSGKLMSSIVTMSSGAYQDSLQSTSPTLLPNKWYHVAFVWKNAVAMELFLDGELVATKNINRSTLRHIGDSLIGLNPQGQLSLRGSIDEASYWDRALTQQEIKELMRIKLTGTETNLKSYWSFNEGTGSIVQEEITKANVTITGSYSWDSDSAPIWSKRFLFDDNGELKRWNNDLSDWEVVGSSPASEELFLNYGMEDLSIIDNEKIQLLVSDKPKFVYWTEEPITNNQLVLRATPRDRLVTPLEDINISNISSIKSFELNSTYTGLSKVAVVVSFDSGTTWYTWDISNSDWKPVALDVSIIKTEGITPDVLKSIDAISWDTLRGTSETIRFAYFIGMDSINDEFEVESLLSIFDMNGYWRHYKNADWEYRSNKMLTVFLYDSGDFKINY